MPEADYKRYHSFTRLPLSNLEIREKIVILSILTVETKSAKDKFAPSPISISLIDLNGKIIVNSLITPRNPVRHYKTGEHGYKEEHILGKWDEYDCLKYLVKILYQKIIVGFRVYNSLAALQFPIDRLMGIRDLAVARCLITSGLELKRKNIQAFLHFQENHPKFYFTQYRFKD